jgi:hypothetical protein
MSPCAECALSDGSATVIVTHGLVALLVAWQIVTLL